MTKAHIHNENMRLYAEDAAKTDKPWELWQVSHQDTVGSDWDPCLSHPEWLLTSSYRRKPRMITVGKHSWPEPESALPPYGTPVFEPNINLKREDGILFICYACKGDSGNHECMTRGMLHLTKEAAQAHADALIAISRGDI